MIQLASHDLCNGCQACGSVCPQEAITFGADAEGFLHPTIDAAKCIACHRCEKACPVLVPNPPRKPLAVYAAIAKDDGVRAASSSGGLFTLLARRTIAAGGIVYGAAIRESDLMVAHCSAETEDELARLRGSKYVQSDVGDVYRQVKAQLATGRQVLFSGTPCQIAVLNRTLGDHPKLVLCAVICRCNIPNDVWGRYLRQIEKKAHSRTKSVQFRGKQNGWREPAFSIQFEDSSRDFSEPLSRNSYWRLVCAGWAAKAGCYRCPFRAGKSGADIVIGDFWGIEHAIPEFDDDKGVSVALIYSDKGLRLLDESDVEKKEVTYEQALMKNPHIETSPSCNVAQRRRFLEVYRNVTFSKAIRYAEYGPLPCELMIRPIRFVRRACGYLSRKIKEFGFVFRKAFH